MGIARKLEDVRRALDLIATQENIAQSLNNTENAQKLNDLVDDIREAVTDYLYQVCTSEGLTLITSNVYLPDPGHSFLQLSSRLLPPI